MKLKELYTVSWLDPSGDAHWFGEAELEGWIAEQLLPCVSVGWLVKETPKFIILADSKNMSGEWGGISLIYKSLITRYEKI